MRDLEREYRLYRLWKQKGFEIPHEMLLNASRYWKIVSDMIKEDLEKIKNAPPKGQVSLFEEDLNEKD